MIRSMGKVPLSGQMAENISENGTKVNNMAKEHIQTSLVKSKHRSGSKA